MEKETQELLDKLSASHKQYGDALAGKADVAVIEEIKKEQRALRDDLLKQLKEAPPDLTETVGKLEATVKENAENMTKFRELTEKYQSKGEISHDIAGLFVSKLTENSEAIFKNLKAGVGSTFTFEAPPNLLKVAGTMTTANYTGGTVGLTGMEPGVARQVRRRPFLRELVSTGVVSDKWVGWVEQINPDPNAAGMTSEGSDKTQMDFDWIERTKKVEKVTAYIKVSTETLEDLPFALAEIYEEIREQIDLKLDAQIYSGDDSTPNLKGITEYATAYATPTAMSANVTAANNFDALIGASTQVSLANFDANYAVINPGDYGMMNVTKGTDGQYARPFVFWDVNGMNVGELVLVKNNLVTAGDFLVGDFNRSNLRIRKSMTIRVVETGSDATKNLVTIIGEMRAVHFVKTNHVGAFSYGDFDTAISELQNPS